MTLLQTPEKEWPKPKPGPQYKDCANCPDVLTCRSEQERRDFCKQCPIESAYIHRENRKGNKVDRMPRGPSERLLRALELASLPITDSIKEQLEYKEAQDYQTVKEYKESKMMGAKLFG